MLPLAVALIKTKNRTALYPGLVEWIIDIDNVELDNLVGVHGWIFPGHPLTIYPFCYLWGDAFKIFICQAKPILQIILWIVMFRGSYVTPPSEICGGVIPMTKVICLIINFYLIGLSANEWTLTNKDISIICGFQFFKLENISQETLSK